MGALVNNNVSTQSNLACTVTLAGNASIGGAGTLSMGAITDSGSGYSLTIVGPGMVIEGPNTTYTGGTVVNGGTLQMNNTGALGSSSGAMSVNNGAVLDLNGQWLTTGPLVLTNVVRLASETECSQ